MRFNRSFSAGCASSVRLVCIGATCAAPVPPPSHPGPSVRLSECVLTSSPCRRLSEFVSASSQPSEPRQRSCSLPRVRRSRSFSCLWSVRSLSHPPPPAPTAPQSYQAIPHHSTTISASNRNESPHSALFRQQSTTIAPHRERIVFDCNSVTLTPCQRLTKPCNSSDKIQGFSCLTMKNCAFCMKHATNSPLFALFWRGSDYIRRLCHTQRGIM